MVWSRIHLKAGTALVRLSRRWLTGQSYITDIIEEYALPFAPFTYWKNFVPMKDNARPHISRIVQQYQQ